MYNTKQAQGVNIFLFRVLEGKRGKKKTVEQMKEDWGRSGAGGRGGVGRGGTGRGGTGRGRQWIGGNL